MEGATWWPAVVRASAFDAENAEFGHEDAEEALVGCGRIGEMGTEETNHRDTKDTESYTEMFIGSIFCDRF